MSRSFNKRFCPYYVRVLHDQRVGRVDNIYTRGWSLEHYIGKVRAGYFQLTAPKWYRTRLNRELRRRLNNDLSRSLRQDDMEDVWVGVSDNISDADWYF